MKIAVIDRRLPRVLSSLLLAVSVAGAGAAQAQAQADGPSDQAERGGRSEERQADHRALAEAVRRVERATRGEVLSAERVQSDGHDVSRVKVVDASGRVRVYMDDVKPRERRDDRTRRDDSNND